MKKVLVINPGSTSTKVAYYEDKQECLNESVHHETTELEKFDTIADQYEYRLALIQSFLDDKKIDRTDFDAVVGRGGSLPPVEAGAFLVNDTMIDWLVNKTDVHHASNLGAMLAKGFQEQSKEDCIAMIYDPITVDQYHELSRVSGLKGVKRRSIGHMLNMRAIAMKTAQDLNKDYNDLNLIVAHLGSGSTISAHEHGRMIDLSLDDEGPFSVERTGSLSLKEIIPLCYTMSQAEMMTWLRKKGGMISYLGTNSGIEVEQRIAAGDEEAKLIFEAMAYQVAKGIGELATVLKGNVDQIVITGGLAYSNLLTDWITERVSFIAPVTTHPGEFEMEALRNGALRVLSGEEVPHDFSL
ncbi:butyrate kinase [Vagococcus penaei]|uniref:Probable butyrate kinase n=2 Tax=Vagococcus penaei TaxID=633807 RepID=A0A1Q2D4C3_9ENTE|nr:butyrate kinase [Vagococcus penaei]AQP53254.1 butyrate kinase [Vagococcus penaei]RSU04023.1 butyrate kinase [Vagococcus penaei]